MAPIKALALLAALAAPAECRMSTAAKLSSNPIRRVVSMMQNMQAKVIEEGEREEKMFNEFTCYCATGGKTLQASIEEATARLPQLQSQLEGMGAENVQLGQDIDQAKIDRAAAEKAIQEATGIREKDAAAFAASSAEQQANVDAMAKAVAALEKGMGAAFLQSSAASVVSKVLASGSWSEYDIEAVTSFLQAGQGDSGAILGIIKQMHETMSKDLADDTAAEAAAVKEYEGLIEAKTKEVKALSKAIEEKTARRGNMGVELVEIKEAIEDTTKTLAEDQLFLKDMDKNCATKKQEWDVRSKLRADELVALADTIKILNDDDALDLFKKAIPSPSLMQLQVTSKDVIKRAREALARRHDPRLDLISLALHGKKVSMEKVIGMIDEMVTLLKTEQADDDHKKEYCAQQFDEAEDQVKALQRQEGQLTTSIAEGKEAIAALVEDIKALTAGIQSLDKQVAEATQLRKEENEAFKEELAMNSAAKELLGAAKNRLNQFYNPSLAKAAPKEEQAPASLVQVALHRAGAKGAPPPPPETFGAYTNKGEESNGVIGMVDMLIKDLDKEITEGELEEKNSQEDYETLMANSAEKRKLDAATLENQESTKAAAEDELLKHTQEHKATQHEIMAHDEYIMGLHGECDWLVSNFDVRKKARADEIDSLGRAKAVLSGADYSLVQTSVHSRLLRGRRA